MAAKNEVAPPIEEEKKSGGKLKWILVAVLLVLLGGGGFAAYWFLMGPGASSPEQTAQEQEQREPGADPQQKMTPEIITLPAFIVNLADPLGRRFLRLTLDVEVVSKEAAGELNRLDSRVRDAIILLLSSKTYTDLASMESKITLKNEIVDRLNQIVGTARVSNVYFTEFVIQ
ncbi:MAG TPA: flagellar basal body-associated FliL family protein [Desulfonatronum sp.]|nr:flagellar basal body-associated FliL family protein [Desulfonatronum sp.]